jgi:hypothetical protein
VDTRRRRVTPAGLALVLGGVLALGACGSAGTPNTTAGPSAAPSAAPAPTIDPAYRAYCDAVRAVQAEQTSPKAGQGGVTAASAAARRQTGSLVATAPPEIAGDWYALQSLTDRALGSLAATGGDPKRIDRKALDAISRQAQPTVTRIKTVTERRCAVRFSAPGGAGDASAAPSSPPSSSSSSRTSRSSPSSRTSSDG